MKLFIRPAICAVIWLTVATLAASAWSQSPLRTSQLALETQLKFHELKHPDLDLLGGQWATLQDKQGFIWFGGAGGVARYDGYELKLYRHDTEDATSLSHNYVTDLLIDNAGTLWVATLWGLNRYDADNDRFIRFEHDENDPTSLPHNWVWTVQMDSSGRLWLATDGGGLVSYSEAEGFVRHGQNGDATSQIPSLNLQSLFVDSNDVIWAGTKADGLARYLPDTGGVKHYPSIKGDTNSLSHPKVNVINEDALGNLWVGTDNGLNVLRAGSSTFGQFFNQADDKESLSGNLIRAIFEDSKSRLWIATDGGGLSILKGEGRFSQYRAPLGGAKGLINDKIRSIFEDPNGGLWFGHYPAGISKVDAYASAFNVYQYDHTNDNSLSNSDIISVLKADDGLWVGTEKGLNFIDFASNNVTRYPHIPDEPTSVPADPVISVAKDRHGNIWAATWGGGVGKLTSGQTKFKRYQHDPNNPNSLQDNVIRSLYVDSQGVLWMGGAKGVSRYREKTDDFIHFKHDPNNKNTLLNLGVNAFLEDSHGNFWVGGDLGLQRLNRDSGHVERFTNDESDQHSIAPGYISALGEDNEGYVWIASGGTGLNRLDTRSLKFAHFTKKDGLADNNVGGIISDDQGYMWFGTGRGLSRHNLKSGEFKTFNKEHGLPGNVYKKPTTARLSNGSLVFGSTKGLAIFNPTRIASNTTPPLSAITHFEVFNKPAKIGGQDSPLTKTIDQTDALELSHKQSVFSITYAALDYTMPTKNQYAYQLEGFDQDWVQAGTRRSTTYTNLDAGEYIFKVKSANNEGVWNESGDELRITVLPAPWRTWWAYTLYTLALLALITHFVMSQRRKLKDAQERIKIEQRVVERLENLDKLKDDFLANTSHELRTPINGIIGLAETLMNGSAGELSAELKNNLNMISISGRRLSHLVNDILDFSKLKSRHIDVQLKPVNVSAIVDVVLTLCHPSTKGKDLKLINHVPADLSAVIADENRLQQIFYNLVGNAIKFTPEGAVEVSAYEADEKIWIAIKDTGKGIPDEMQDKIFVPFEQVEDHQNRSQGGTGLGLTVTKQIVELMDGEISVSSVVGRGSTFTFNLPMTHEKASSATQSQTEQRPVAKCLDLDTSTTDTSGASSQATTSALKSETKNAENAHFKILIVDDDAINRKVLENQLGLQGYQTVSAVDGRNALELVDNEGPFDLILLDIMMPEMSGYEVCSELRRFYSIQELPIIFLTAKNLISDLTDGFELGANDFLTKPIAIGELSSRVHTHLSLLDINRSLERKVDARTAEVTLANRELETLDTIVATIHQELRFDRLIRVILKEATALFPAINRAAYWHGGSENGEFRLITPHAIEQFGTSRDHAVTMVPNDYLRTFYLAEDNRINEFLYCIKEHRITNADYPTHDIQGAKCALAVTLVLDEDIVGMLVLASDTEADCMHALKPSTVERFRTHVTSALTKSHLVDLLEKNCTTLKRMSITDQLTGLHNRRFLYDSIEPDIRSVIDSYSKFDNFKPESADYNLFLVDIDFFKAINDTRGHLAGDKILIQFSKILKSLVRDSDYCIRWGGEEFLIITRLSTREAAGDTAEKIRSAVADHKFIVEDGVELNRTCSIGFASFPLMPQHPASASWEQVLDIADICLYAAKVSQRNAWVGITGIADGASSTLINELMTLPEQAIQDPAVTLQSNIEEEKIKGWKAL